MLLQPRGTINWPCQTIRPSLKLHCLFWSSSKLAISPTISPCSANVWWCGKMQPVSFGAEHAPHHQALAQKQQLTE